MAWSDIPTCKEQGLDVDYLMLRGIFMRRASRQDQVTYYVELLQEGDGDAGVEEADGAGRVQHHRAHGKEYADWVAREEARHIALMKAAGFIAGKK
jgi:putative tricarboxylic transport membrane protein